MKIEKINNTEDTQISQKTATKSNEYEDSDFQSLVNGGITGEFTPFMQNLENLCDEMTLELDSLNISEEDAIFFNEIVRNPQFSLSVSKGELINLSELSANNDIQVYKPMSVSKGLFNMISKAQQTQKPVRLDFDNNVTVILKVCKEGKLTAEFIPGDAAVAEYLRNNIPYLKQRFDEQNLAYNDIYYRQGNKGQYRQQFHIPEVV